MSKPIDQHEGKKYLRRVRDVTQPDCWADVDVYAVLVAFGVTCPARAHAVKKLLCCGSRGKGGEMADLLGVEAAVARAIELQRERDAAAAPDPKTKMTAAVQALWDAADAAPAPAPKRRKR